MNYLARLVILTSIMGLLSIRVRGGYFQAYKPPIEAKAGYVATGTVVRQDSQKLILNTTPCRDRDKQIVIFHSPFGAKNAKPISCPAGKTFQQVTAKQG